MTGFPSPDAQARQTPADRAKTLRVSDLLQTKVQCVRIELVAGENSTVDRLGTWLFYLPFLLTGYALVLVAAMSAVHGAIGWGPTLLLFGAAHLGVGIWGVLRGPTVGSVTRDAVLEPHFVSVAESPAEPAKEAGDAIPRLRLPVLPLPLRLRVPRSENPSLPGV